MPDKKTRVHLNRALSKLGILTRSQANEAILAGRVRVNGRIVRDPAASVDPEKARFTVDGEVRRRAPWRTILFHKPRGVVTTRSDPEGRQTIYDVIGEEATGLRPVGRLDRATSGVLLLTSDTGLADRLTDPANGVPRLYAVTVRGRVDAADVATLERGIVDGDDDLKAESARVRKASDRESHLMIELREGKNREIRRLCAAIGHEVTRLKRVRYGALELGDLAAGQWRAVDEEEVHRSFPEPRPHPPRKV